QVVAMLARYRRAGILTGFDLGEAEEDPVDGETDELAERFVADLEAMGPAFVKLGQALSTRPDLVPASWITAPDPTQDDPRPAPPTRSPTPAAACAWPTGSPNSARRCSTSSTTGSRPRTWSVSRATSPATSGCACRARCGTTSPRGCW